MSEFEESLIQRLLVVNELGPVHKGDHVIMVANVIVAVDTSRRPDDVMSPSVRPTPPEKAAPAYRRVMPKRPSHHKKPLAAITEKAIYTVIRDNQPITSIAISDKMGFERNDVSSRSKVTNLLRRLVDSRQVKRYKKPDGGLFRYEVETDQSAQA